jgi:Na+-transporting NADH:ubiquinone oxidoreductase subunit NqrC
VVPSYAIALGLARWISLTLQVTWVQSFARGSYPTLSELIPEPIFVVNLPGRSFVALDTKLGIDLIHGTFIPLMKGVVGLFLDRQKAISISAWGQATLTSQAVDESFRFGVGVGLAYYFDF